MTGPPGFSAHLLVQPTCRFGAVRSPLGPLLVMLTHRRAVDRVRSEQVHPRPTYARPDLPADDNLEANAYRALLGEQTVALQRELPEGNAAARCCPTGAAPAWPRSPRSWTSPVGTVKSPCRRALRRLPGIAGERGLDPCFDGPKRAWRLAP